MGLGSHLHLYPENTGHQAEREKSNGQRSQLKCYLSHQELDHIFLDVARLVLPSGRNKISREKIKSSGDKIKLEF